MDKPKKVAVIGFDCALPHLIEKHIAEGHLPNFKRLIEGGVIADNCLVPLPTITPPNWATIATGANIGTHQVTDFSVHEPGSGLPGRNPEAFSSERCQAEFLWDTADKAGKKCIVLNYPGAWPSQMKNGVMVGGAGLTIGELRDGFFGLNSTTSVCHEQLVTTGVYPGAMRGTLKPAAGWSPEEELGEDPLEMEALLAFPQAQAPVARTVWYLLLRQSAGDGYDRATLSPTRNLKDAFCTLGLNEWSPKVFTTIRMQDGTDREAFFRCKLLELSDDGEDVRFYIGALGSAKGWSNPAEISDEVVSPEGTLSPAGGVIGYGLGWYELDTYVDLSRFHDLWLGDVATTLLTKHDWDVFFMHSHPPDWMYHVILTDMDANTQPDVQRRELAWDAHLRVYQSQDAMLGRIVEAIGDDTLVILVSDHGATPDGPTFNPYQALAQAGLASFTESAVQRSAVLADAGLLSTGSEAPKIQGRGMVAKMATARAVTPNIKESKAIPQRSIYVYINLKGREPEGIVEPSDYEKVQLEIVDALLTYVDPATGKRPVALALTKQDARLLGLYGDGVGDVVYAVYPWFGGQHGQILPTAEWGVGSLKGLLILNGPGIKTGHRLQRTVGLQDVVPTICYLLDLPVPETAEGAVIYQALADPNFKVKEIVRLREGLAKMEAQLAGG